MVFVHAESRSIVKKVHASYSTCVRQSLKDELENKTLCQNYMDKCSFFAIAIDSTLIRNEHLFSCFARFSFEDRLIQIPLFFDTYHQLSGDGVAHLVYNKLAEHNCEFEKLVCVSSDGASNMIGSLNGMTVVLKRLIEQHCTERQKPFNNFHSVWCLAHRLNLVTKDLLECERLTVVKAFCDWFSDRRRQASFKAFLSQRNVCQKLKCVPQPSDTRWLFYRGVIASIMSQDSFVEAFIQGREGFTTVWNSLVEDDERYGLSPDKQFSLFDDKFRSVFLFAKSVLEIFGRVNQVFKDAI